MKDRSLFAIPARLDLAILGVQIGAVLGFLVGQRRSAATA
jgi:hypothetical protein